jgi:uncharacterized membrane protein
MDRLENLVRKVNIETLENFLDSKVFNINLSTLVVGVAIVFYSLIFSYFTIIKNFQFRTYAWDLGIFNQALWTTLHDGKLFYYTCELLLNPSGSFFGIHFSPIIFLLLPVYAIHPAPQTLLVTQSFILALAALPLYKLVIHVLKYRVVGIVFVLLYLLYPPLQGVNWFDFHVQSFLPLFFLSAIYFFEKQNWKTYFLFILLSLMCEEHASMIVIFIGFFAILQYKDRLIFAVKTRKFKDTFVLVAIATIVVAVFWYLMTLWIRGTFFPVNPDFIYEFNAAENWIVLGVKNPIEIPLYIVLHPARAITALSYDFLAKIGYLLILFGPLALRPLFSLKHILPAFPWLLYALFSNYQPYYGISNQYPAYIIAFIFTASIFAIVDKGGIDDVKVLKRRLAAMLLCSLVAVILVSPLSPLVTIVYPESGLGSTTEHEKFLHEILTYVPRDASIMTQSNIFPHVSSRINAYAIPTIHLIWRRKVPEFKNFTCETLRNVEFVLVDIKSDYHASELMFSLLQENHEFRVFASAAGIILFKKNYDGDATILAPYNVTYDYRSLALYSGEIMEDPNSTSGTVLYFNGSSGYSPMFWYGPRSILASGKYNVTLRLKINGTGEIFTVQFCSKKGQQILASETLFGSNTASKAVWVNQTFSLNLHNPIIDFEVRAINVSPQAYIHLDYIEIKQVSSETE